MLVKTLTKAFPKYFNQTVVETLFGISLPSEEQALQLSDAHRILILGSSGAGKSTLARKLREKLGLPIIHLDQHYWRPDWIRTPDTEWEKTVEKLIATDQWIMDGHFLSTLERRLSRADVVIMLNSSRFVCLVRVIKRQLRNDRLDKIAGCKDRLNLKFLYYILWQYPQKNKKIALELLKEVKGEKKIYVLKSNYNVKNFVDRIT